MMQKLATAVDTQLQSLSMLVHQAATNLAQAGCALPAIIMNAPAQHLRSAAAFLQESKFGLTGEDKPMKIRKLHGHAGVTVIARNCVWISKGKRSPFRMIQKMSETQRATVHTTKCNALFGSCFLGLQKSKVHDGLHSCPGPACNLCIFSTGCCHYIQKM